MAFDFRTLKRCGAKARSRNGESCKQAAMKGTERCYWHDGPVAVANTKHGRYSNRAIQRRREFNKIFKELKSNLLTIL